MFVEGLRYKSGGIFFGELSRCVSMQRAVLVPRRVQAKVNKNAPGLLLARFKRICRQPLALKAGRQLSVPCLVYVTA